MNKWAVKNQSSFVWSGACNYIEETYFLSAVGFAMNNGNFTFESPGVIMNDCYAILSGAIVIVFPPLFSWWLYLVWTFDVSKIKVEIDPAEAYVDHVYVESAPENI